LVAGVEEVQGLIAGFEAIDDLGWGFQFAVLMKAKPD
jgi:hypothetical protein